MNPAGEYAQRAIALSPAEARLHVRLAQLYNAANRRDDALAKINRELEKNPPFAPAYKILGEVQIARGDLKFNTEMN